MTVGEVDVAVVGAAIAGGVMATVLARAGLDVLLLERDVAYRDRVRGETMFPWGLAEVDRLGLRQVLEDAGRGFAQELIEYDERLDPATRPPIPLHAMIASVPGALNVGHPQSCHALATSAETGPVVWEGCGEGSGARPD
jgi:2-polyprenyl-6-methoxyphenol hydroxylase-like FAD-dependent oxidoreductase